MSNSFNSEMEALRILLWNAADDDDAIQPRLSVYNFTPEVLGEAKELWIQTDALDKKQDRELGEQKDATDQFNEAWKMAQKKLKRAKRMARIVFEGNNAAWDLLDLKTLNATRYEDWQKMGESFYENMLASEGLVEKMSELTYTSEKLQNEYNNVTKLKELQEVQKQETGDAQQATRDKWASFNELQGWCNRLEAIAKLEFEEDPQMLEKLGIRVR